MTAPSPQTVPQLSQAMAARLAAHKTRLAAKRHPLYMELMELLANDVQPAWEITELGRRHPTITTLLS